jgi:hypothetical protein
VVQTPSHKPLLTSLFEDTLSKDLVFLVGQGKVPTHRAVVSSSSAPFKELLAKHPTAADICFLDPRIKLRAFESLIRYVYGQEIAFDVDAAFEIRYLATLFDFQELAQRCSSYLTASSPPHDASTVINRALSWNDLDVVIDLFLSKTPPPGLLQKFRKLPYPLALQLLDQDLSVKEADMFEEVVMWINEHPREFRESGELLSKVRYALISPEDLIRKVKPTQLVPVEVFILPALEFRFTGEVPDNISINFAKPRRSLVKLTWDLIPAPHVQHTTWPGKISTRDIFGCEEDYLSVEEVAQKWARLLGFARAVSWKVKRDGREPTYYRPKPGTRYKVGFANFTASCKNKVVYDVMCEENCLLK